MQLVESGSDHHLAAEQNHFQWKKTKKRHSCNSFQQIEWMFMEISNTELSPLHQSRASPDWLFCTVFCGSDQRPIYNLCPALKTSLSRFTTNLCVFHGWISIELLPPLCDFHFCAVTRWMTVTVLLICPSATSSQHWVRINRANEISAHIPLHYLMKGSSGPCRMMLITLLIHFSFNWISRMRIAVESVWPLIALIILTTKDADRGRSYARGAQAAAKEISTRGYQEHWSISEQFFFFLLHFEWMLYFLF